MRLRAVQVLRGRAPSDVSRTFRYLDLGCGRGFTLVALAAAFPHGEFLGIDVSPDHVLDARATAEAVGVADVAFREASFADLIEAPGETGEVDFVACHGVYSWIGQAERARVVEILRRHVRPGARVPGLRRHARLGGGGAPAPADPPPRRGRRGEAREDAIDEAIAYLGLLREGSAGMMRHNEQLARWLDRTADQTKSCLAHEYLPEDGGALWHDEVAAELAAARLSPIGSARYVDDLDRLNFDDAIRAKIAEVDRRGLGETFRANRSFRQDVFARGAPRRPAEEADAALENLLVAAVEPPVDRPPVMTARGDITLVDPGTRHLAEIVAEGPCTVGEAADRAVADGGDRRRARQSLVALLAAVRLEPPATTAPSREAVAACVRFNRLALAARGAWPALVSATLGGGLSMPPEAIRFLAGEPVETTGEAGDGQVGERIAALRARRPLLERLAMTG